MNFVRSLIAALRFFSWAAPPAPEPPPPPAVPVPADPPEPHPDARLLGVEESALLFHVNRLRVAEILPGLTHSVRLTWAAQNHALDLASLRREDMHAGSDGSRYYERIAREGYPLADDLRNVQETAGRGNVGSRVIAEAWMDSTGDDGKSGHRAVVLGAWSDVGVGVAQGPAGRYFVACYGRK